MYLIIILTIEINNDNNKNDIVWPPEKQKYQKSRKEEQ
jgi:hypothetical protein